MRVSFKNEKLWNSVSKKISIVSSISLFGLEFINLDEKTKECILCIELICFIIIYLWSYMQANRTENIDLMINDTVVHIKYGDIFEENNIKVIAFNEYFDTLVDNQIVSEKSLNGIYIKKYVKDIEKLDESIATSDHLKRNIIGSNTSRKGGGKSVKYKLGSIYPNREFFLLALSRFDDNNRAVLTVEEYISALLYMWKELDVNYQGNPIALPLVGSGITRFEGYRLNAQEILEYILTTFKISRVRFCHGSSVTIVINPSIKDEINLYNINY